ncbi:MAG: hypothetical protein R3E66_09735 [bacterium]
MKAPQKFEVPSQLRNMAAGMAVVGFTVFAAALVMHNHSAWNAYLIGYWFTLSLALSGPFINATQFLAIAGWSVSVRRIGEAFGAFIPWAAVLFIPIAIGGVSTLYHWWDQAYVAADPILSKKAAWLNPTFFWGSCGAALVAVTGASMWMRKLSLDMDATGDAAIYHKQKIAATVYLVSFVIGFSMLSWNLLMSLEPHWFSTMWAVYTFAGMFQSGLALMVLVLLWLQGQGYFGDFAGTKQVHDLGKLLFGFTVFYAYIGFSQFMLIWYANIPEEAIWFVARGTPTDISTGWDVYSIILPFAKFVLPFLILLPQEHKKNKNNILGYVAAWLLMLQVYEVWLWVAPTPHVKGELATAPALPWLELITTLGFFGLFGVIALNALAKANLVPTKDPFLAETVEHHHHGVRPAKREHITIS